MALDSSKTYSDIVRLYDIMSNQREDEISFYASFMETGRDFLEAGCGTGILSERLVRLGYNVFGIDNSQEMLSLCKNRIPAEQTSLADMRDFDLGRTFDLVTIPYNTLPHMPSSSDVLKTFTCMRKHCALNGRFVFSLYHQSPENHKLEWAIQGINHFYDDQSGEVSALIRGCKVDLSEQRLTMSWNVMDTNKTVFKRRHFLETTLYSNEELVTLLHKAGFVIEDCYKDYVKNPFTIESSRQIFVAVPKL